MPRRAGGTVRGKEKAMTARTQFTFYKSYYDALLTLPQREGYRLIRAICEYSLYGTVPELSGQTKTMFTLIRPTLSTARKHSDTAKTQRSAQQADGRQKQQ